MKIIDKIDNIFVIVSSVFLFIIMFIVSIDGLLRQFFDSPITGAYVLVENYLMVAMIFCALSYTWATKGHISITFVHDKLPLAIRNVTYLFILLIGISVVGVIGYTGFERTLSAFSNNHLTSGLTRWPLWLAYIWIPLGSLMFCLRLLIEFILGIKKILKYGINKKSIQE